MWVVARRMHNNGATRQYDRNAQASPTARLPDQGASEELANPLHAAVREGKWDQWSSVKIFSASARLTPGTRVRSSTLAA